MMAAMMLPRVQPTARSWDLQHKATLLLVNISLVSGRRVNPGESAAQFCYWLSHIWAAGYQAIPYGPSTAINLFHILAVSIFVMWEAGSYVVPSVFYGIVSVRLQA
jgi:hypothetical protein